MYRIKLYYQSMFTLFHIVKGLVKLVLALALTAVIIALVAVGLPNAVEIVGQRGNIHSIQEVRNDARAGNTYDCILVLGASVLPSGQPSTILADRIDVAVELYNAGVAPKIIMSGDDESENTYDEVNNMKAYAVSKGVPSKDVFCDHAGINTYDSMYRAYHVFSVKKMVVVTQTYHLYRALFDARAFGIDAIGVPADIHTYAKQAQFSTREIFARSSDMLKVITNRNATFLSEPVSLKQSGDVTSWQRRNTT